MAENSWYEEIMSMSPCVLVMLFFWKIMLVWFDLDIWLTDDHLAAIIQVNLCWLAASAKNWRICCSSNFTACMPLLTATSTFGLRQRCFLISHVMSVIFIWIITLASFWIWFHSVKCLMPCTSIHCFDTTARHEPAPIVQMASLWVTPEKRPLKPKQISYRKGHVWYSVLFCMVDWRQPCALNHVELTFFEYNFLELIYGECLTTA